MRYSIHTNGIILTRSFCTHVDVCACVCESVGWCNELLWICVRHCAGHDLKSTAVVVYVTQQSRPELHSNATTTQWKRHRIYCMSNLSVIVGCQIVGQTAARDLESEANIYARIGWQHSSHRFKHACSLAVLSCFLRHRANKFIILYANRVSGCDGRVCVLIPTTR